MSKKRKRTATYKKHIGQAPGTLVYTGDKTNNKLEIECLDYSPDHAEMHSCKTVENTFPFKTTDSITWINLNGLNHVNTIEKLGSHYQMHPLTLEDIANTGQRPKIDLFDDYVFVVLKMVYYDADEIIKIEQVSFVLGNNYVMTFQEAEGDVFQSVRNRIQSGKGRIRNQGADYLFYALIDAVVDHYYIVIETMGNKIEELEDDLFTGNVPEDISQQIQRLKKELLRVRRAIFPLKEIINRIEKTNSHLIGKDSIQFFRDVNDHSIQLSDSIEIYREMIWGLMDMYMTSISNKMNEVMKVLTIIATIFIPLTFIAGVYGMNFDHMPELHFKYGYHIIWGVMILIFIAMIVYFKRKKWL